MISLGYAQRWTISRNSAFGGKHTLYPSTSYRATRRIRGAEHVSLRSQTTRAAMSIPTNIVEGNGYKSNRDFIRFLGYSVNSANELEYHLIVAHDLELLPKRDFRALVDQLVEVRKMIHGLINYLSRKDDEEKNKDAE